MATDTTLEPVTKERLVAAMQERLNAGGRGGAYMIYYEFLRGVDEEAAKQILMQAQITTYSGFFGGAALVANAIVKNSNPEEYTVTVDEFSIEIVQAIIDSVDANIGAGGDGSLSADDILASDKRIWAQKGMEEFFPGNVELYSLGFDVLASEGTVAAGLALMQLSFGAKVGNQAEEFTGSQYQRTETTEYVLITEA